MFMVKLPRGQGRFEYERDAQGCYAAAQYLFARARSWVAAKLMRCDAYSKHGPELSLTEQILWPDPVTGDNLSDKLRTIIIS
jgi:hypothetical protein